MTKFYSQLSRKRIIYLQRKIYFSLCPIEKLYYKNLLEKEIMNLQMLSNYYSRQETNEPERQFTLEELATYNGSSGKSAYVAVNGIVYDVSLQSTWGGGTHFGLYSGKDLTKEFNECHGREEILKVLPKVGILKG
ncbi:cytochrome b5 domain-containing protein [Clostridium cochlearium]|uniref:cytochrome b5 domain-containing protein n=1 Tax=Clostridium cochlearium TaxID=1494 RepID=UPI0022E4CD34|nr:cytochrome b5 domain-containing protein [Clostridium cochlearium]